MCCASGNVDDCYVCDGGNTCFDCDGTKWGPGVMHDGECCASGYVDICGVCDGDGVCKNDGPINSLAGLQSWCEESRGTRVGDDCEVEALLPGAKGVLPPDHYELCY